MRGTNKASSIAITATDRQQRAVELRLGGHTLETIADMLGYSHARGASKAIESALRKTLQEPSDQIRALELRRLDELLIGVWEKATSGDTYALDRVLKIMDRRANYLGLDAPKESKVLHEVSSMADRVANECGLNTADIIAEAERIVAAAGVPD